MKLTLRWYMVALLLAAVTTATAAYADDPFAGVDGADRPVDLRLPDTPLVDVLARVAQTTGLHLSAEGLAADLRVTVIAHQRPAAQVLNALATHQQLAWRSDARGYVLCQAAEARAQDEAARADLLRRSADLIYQEVTSPPDPPDPALDSPVGRGLLAALGREGILRLLQSGLTQYAWPARPGCLPIPRQILDRGLPELSTDPNAPPGQPRARFVHVAFSAMATNLLPGFLCWVYSGELNDAGTREQRGGGIGFPVPLGTRSRTSVYQAEPPSEGQDSPALARQVSFDLPDVVKWPPTSPQEQLLKGKPRWHTTGEALAALDKALPTDIVADSFALQVFNGLHAAGLPLRQALDEVARQSMCRWRSEDGFVMMTHRNRAMCRLTDPPARVLARWRADISAGKFGLKDWVEVASLPDPQFETLQMYVEQTDALPTSVTAIVSARSHLALWGSLSESQRAAAVDKGLPYSGMNPAQKTLFLRCINSFKESSGIYMAPEATLAALVPNAVLRARAVPVTAWGVRGTDRSTSGGAEMTREMAALSLGQPDQTPGVGDIRKGACTDYKWEYVSGKQVLATGYVRTPIVWLED